ncbi:hypothetical protein ACFQH6_15040 [Halobacteriaceae archaeon GCM10025711]
MIVEVSAKVEIDEDSPEAMNRLTQALSTLGALEGTDVGVESVDEDEAKGDEETKSLDEILEELPSDEHRYVYRALIQESGHSRRVIHRKACELEGSPFDDFDPDKETSERGEIGNKLWSLQSRGYAKHDGNRWYPIPEQFTNSALGW